MAPEPRAAAEASPERFCKPRGRASQSPTSGSRAEALSIPSFWAQHPAPPPCRGTGAAAPRAHRGVITPREPALIIAAAFPLAGMLIEVEHYSVSKPRAAGRGRSRREKRRRESQGESPVPCSPRGWTSIYFRTQERPEPPGTSRAGHKLPFQSPSESFIKAKWVAACCDLQAGRREHDGRRGRESNLCDLKPLGDFEQIPADRRTSVRGFAIRERPQGAQTATVTHPALRSCWKGTGRLEKSRRGTLGTGLGRDRHPTATQKPR